MIQTPFSLSLIKVLACFIRFEKCQIFQICVIPLIVVLFVLHKLILQTSMHSRPVGLDV